MIGMALAGGASLCRIFLAPLAMMTLPKGGLLPQMATHTSARCTGLLMMTGTGMVAKRILEASASLTAAGFSRLLRPLVASNGVQSVLESSFQRASDHNIHAIPAHDAAPHRTACSMPFNHNQGGRPPSHLRPDGRKGGPCRHLYQ